MATYRCSPPHGVLLAVTGCENRLPEKGELTMPREREGFRDQLARIIDAYPEREMLTLNEVASFCGVCRRTAKTWFSFNQSNMISIVTLAKEMLPAEMKNNY